MSCEVLRARGKRRGRTNHGKMRDIKKDHGGNERRVSSRTRASGQVDFFPERSLRFRSLQIQFWQGSPPTGPVPGGIISIKEEAQGSKRKGGETRKNWRRRKPGPLSKGR